jgi:hypothetical protein
MKAILSGRLSPRSERPVSAVPVPVLAVLIFALAAQIGWHASRPDPVAAAADLPDPPSVEVLHAASLSETAALSRVLMLWLQAFDHQPGISLPFMALDYERLAAWLDRILELDPRSQYPLLSAARVYGEVPDDARRRRMIALIRERFREAPDLRWQWMAHAAILARHRLNDQELALELANDLRTYTSGESTPGWARQMELFILEDLGELEAARILLGGLIESGAVSDPHEIRFLTDRLGK